MQRVVEIDPLRTLKLKYYFQDLFLTIRGIFMSCIVHKNNFRFPKSIFVQSLKNGGLTY